jgi:phosphopantothenoylcysteine decarboxylase/phosphopantothenate--cysteine ligase
VARLLLGVTGSIAAYKALELVRLAAAAGHSVRVIQTPASERFVGRASFAALSGAPVLGDEFETDPLRGAYPGESAGTEQPISHLALVQRADAYLIAPASANTLAKLAHGLAGDLVSTAALAAACPIAVAPAMNHQMWTAAATQANVALLRERGVHLIEPDEGRLASAGEHGLGRLAEPQRLLEELEALLAASADHSLRGLRVLVTAGGTREPIDAVRYIGNRSSGRMGFALARAAARRGARATVVAANVTLPPPPGVELVQVATAAQLASACQARFDDCDVLLMAAAVADFRPAAPSAGKLTKHAHDTLRSIALEATPDVLATLADRRSPDQVLVGFAAEHGPGGVERAHAKMVRKNLDAIVLNDVSQEGIGFDATDNEVTILTADGAERHVARASKEQVAEEICDIVVALRERRRREGDGGRRAPAARIRAG